MNVNQQGLWQLASDFETPSSQLIELSKSEDSHLLRLLGENGNTPAKVLIELASNISSYVRYGVSRNINAPKAALSALANNFGSDYAILISVARHKNTPEDTLRLILNKPLRQSNLTMFAASNVVLSTRMIEEMLPTATLSMKRGFALNPNTPTAVLCDFAKGTLALLRYSVALRSKFPLAVCEIIKNDENVEVLKALIKNESVPLCVIDYIFEHAPRGLVELIALRAALSPVVRGRIIYGANRFAKVNLLQTVAMSSIELASLAKDKSHFVRIEVAKQVNVGVDVLNALKNDPSIQVVIQVIKNPSVSDEILKTLSMHLDSNVRREVASSEWLPRDLSYHLSEDESAHVKIALIRNPNAPIDSCADLAYDLNEDVSRLARRLLSEECVVSSKYEHMAN